MTQGDQDIIILGRLRGWLLMVWMSLMLGIGGYSLWLELSGEGFSDSIYYPLFGRMLGPMTIGISLFGFASFFLMWRRRNDYIRHDGACLFQGRRKSWRLDDIEDVTLIDRPLGKRTIRIVTREGRREYLTDSFHLDGRVSDLRVAILGVAKAARRDGLSLSPRT